MSGTSLRNRKHLNQCRISAPRKQSAVHCRAFNSSIQAIDVLLPAGQSRLSDLARFFGVGFAHGHVRIFGWIWRFFDRKRFGL